MANNGTFQVRLFRKVVGSNRLLSDIKFGALTTHKSRTGKELICQRYADGEGGGALLRDGEDILSHLTAGFTIDLQNHQRPASPAKPLFNQQRVLKFLQSIFSCLLIIPYCQVMTFSLYSTNVVGHIICILCDALHTLYIRPVTLRISALNRYQQYYTGTRYGHRYRQ